MLYCISVQVPPTQSKGLEYHQKLIFLFPIQFLTRLGHFVKTFGGLKDGNSLLQFPNRGKYFSLCGMGKIWNSF